MAALAARAAARALPFITKYAAVPEFIAGILDSAAATRRLAHGDGRRRRRRRGGAAAVSAKYAFLRRPHVYATGGSKHLVRAHMSHTKFGAPVYVRGHFAGGAKRHRRRGGLLTPTGRGRKTHHVKGHYRHTGSGVVRVRAHRSRH